MRAKAVGAFTVGCLVSVAVSSGADWPGWRGEGGEGRSAEKGLPTEWDAGKGTGIRWKAAIPGVGHAAPIVSGRRVFVSTAVSADASTETFKKGLYFGGNQSKPDPAAHTYRLICLDADSGKVLWSKAAVRDKPPSIARHIKNSYASETPVTDGKHVYVSFGPEGLFCFDFDGNEKWSRDLGTFKMAHGWGTSSSPVLHGNTVIVQCDRDNGSYIAAFDKATGEPVWKTARDEKSSWATPFLFTNHGRTELITNATQRMRAYDADTGKLLWECRGASTIVSPTPVSAEGLVFVSSGYVGDSVRPIYAVRPGARGDITLGDDQTRSSAVAWYRHRGGPYIPSPVAYRGRLYVLLDRGFLSAYDAKTGEPAYDRKRLGRHHEFTASPVAADGKIYCLSEQGECYVIQAGPKFELLAVNPLDEVCMASPAIADGKLFIRARKNLYCIGE